jgi:hypothetical protein
MSPKKTSSQYLNFNFSYGLSFIDVLVGVSLVLIIFLGIFGAYQSGLKVVGYSRDKITATSIANQELETIRNMPYQDIGMVDGILPVPVGALTEITTTSLNNIEYTIERRIEYISDSADGQGAADDCDLDYKNVEIKVSWAGRFGGEVVLTTDVAPPNKVQEIASCEAQPGGLLSAQVFNAFGLMVESPIIEIYNPETELLIVSHSPESGKRDIPLAVGTYKVVVSKAGYNSARTYSTEEVANPLNFCHAGPSQVVLEGQLTPVSFCIDKVSSLAVSTFSPWGSDNFTDYFSDGTKISEMNSLVISGREVALATTTEGYLDSGFLVSSAIIPESLNSWEDFIFSDFEPPNTDLKYQVFFATDTDWYLIPEADLAGNSLGFDSSPVNLSELDVGDYFQLKIKGNFSSSVTSSTPVLYDWQISWRTSEPTPASYAEFNLRGEKTIGTDSDENPVYKYSVSADSGVAGQIVISDLEWDLYTFSTEGTDLDLVSIDPSPQPINLAPDTNENVSLYLSSENSLLATIQDSETAGPVFGAKVRLYSSGLGYNQTQYTNDKGQTYFIPLEAGTYDIDIEAPAYASTSESVGVSEDVIKIIGLEQTD